MDLRSESQRERTSRRKSMGNEGIIGRNACRGVFQAAKRKEGGKGKERWDAQRDRYLRGRTVTHKMAIRR